MTDRKNDKTITVTKKLFGRIYQLRSEPANAVDGRHKRRKMFIGEFLNHAVDQAVNQERVADSLREIAFMIRRDSLEHSKLTGDHDDGHLMVMDFLADQIEDIANWSYPFSPSEDDRADQNDQFETWYGRFKKRIRMLKQAARLRKEPEYQDAYKYLQKILQKQVDDGPKD